MTNPGQALLVSVGTDGYIFPYAGLGLELRARGHAVTPVVSEHMNRWPDGMASAFTRWCH